MLSRWVVYDQYTGKAYLSGHRFWEGSLLLDVRIARRVKYPPLCKKEDTPFIQAVIEREAAAIAEIVDPSLYVYRYDGNNTWEREHFVPIFKAGTELDEHSSWLVSQLFSDVPERNMNDALRIVQLDTRVGICLDKLLEGS
jgi:hypothetical protein